MRRKLPGTVQKEKRNARQELNRAVQKGSVVPKPCESCGNPASEPHHTDYSKPLEVRWLCVPCHVRESGGSF